MSRLQQFSRWLLPHNIPLQRIPRADFNQVCRIRLPVSKLRNANFRPNQCTNKLSLICRKFAEIRSCGTWETEKVDGEDGKPGTLDAAYKKRAPRSSWWAGSTWPSKSLVRVAMSLQFEPIREPESPTRVHLGDITGSIELTRSLNPRSRRWERNRDRLEHWEDTISSGWALASARGGFLGRGYSVGEWGGGKQGII